MVKELTINQQKAQDEKQIKSCYNKNRLVHNFQPHSLYEYFIS